jgi:hypothetical protein
VNAWRHVPKVSQWETRGIFDRCRCPSRADLDRRPGNYGPAMGTEAVRFPVLWMAGWVNSGQLKVIQFLQDENRVLREQLGGRRLRFTDDQRRYLAVKGRIVGRPRRGEFAGLGTPEAILHWYRELIGLKSTARRAAGPGALPSPPTWSSSWSGWRQRTRAGATRGWSVRWTTWPPDQPQHGQVRSSVVRPRASTRARQADAVEALPEVFLAMFPHGLTFEPTRTRTGPGLANPGDADFAAVTGQVPAGPVSFGERPLRDSNPRTTFPRGEQFPRLRMISRGYSVRSSRLLPGPHCPSALFGQPKGNRHGRERRPPTITSMRLPVGCLQCFKPGSTTRRWLSPGLLAGCCSRAPHEQRCLA